MTKEDDTRLAEIRERAQRMAKNMNEVLAVNDVPWLITELEKRDAQIAEAKKIIGHGWGESEPLPQEKPKPIVIEIDTSDLGRENLELRGRIARAEQALLGGIGQSWSRVVDRALLILRGQA